MPLFAPAARKKTGSIFHFRHLALPIHSALGTLPCDPGAHRWFVRVQVNLGGSSREKAGADDHTEAWGFVQVVLDLSSNRTPCFVAGPHLISTTPNPPGPRVSREGVVCVTCQEELPELSWTSHPSVSALPPTPNTRPVRQGAVVPERPLLTKRARLPLSPTPPRRGNNGEWSQRHGLARRSGVRCDELPLTSGGAIAFPPPFLPFPPPCLVSERGLGPHKPVTLCPEPSCTRF